MAEIKKDITTSQLLAIIRNSDGVEDFLPLFEKGNTEPSLSEELYSLMQRHQLTPKDVIVASGIERSYFYHILSGCKIPGRNILLRIALSCRAGIAEINQLLRLAGHSMLYSRVRRDALIIFAVTHKYTLQETNRLLIAEGVTPLYREGVL